MPPWMRMLRDLQRTPREESCRFQPSLRRRRVVHREHSQGAAAQCAWSANRASTRTRRASRSVNSRIPVSTSPNEDRASKLHVLVELFLRRGRLAVCRVVSASTRTRRVNLRVCAVPRRSGRCLKGRQNVMHVCHIPSGTAAPTKRVCLSQETKMRAVKRTTVASPVQRATTASQSSTADSPGRLFVSFLWKEAGGVRRRRLAAYSSAV